MSDHDYFMILTVKNYSQCVLYPDYTCTSVTYYLVYSVQFSFRFYILCSYSWRFNGTPHKNNCIYITSRLLLIINTMNPSVACISEWIGSSLPYVKVWYWTVDLNQLAILGRFSTPRVKFQGFFIDWLNIFILVISDKVHGIWCKQFGYIHKTESIKTESIK